MSDSQDQIRKPAVAGLFYPAAAVELSRTVAGYYSEVDKVPVVGHPAGLIVPHAGYPYSGKTAAKAFKLLEGQEYDSVVIVSPSHAGLFRGSSVFDGKGYQTPIGVVEIDMELSEKIADIHPLVYLSNVGHASGSARGEHALEVQLPFLQVVLGNFKMVAIVMGDQEADSISALGETLAAVLKNRNSLIIASSDLSHFHTEKEARKLDMSVQRAVEQYDSAKLLKSLEKGEGEACGGGVMAAVMMATRKLGADNVKFLEYTTSGATTGDFDEVVGYMSAAIMTDKKIEKKDTVLGQRQAVMKGEEPLTDEAGKELKKIAREAIEAKLKDKKYTVPESEQLSQKRGLFVTISLNGELRGCIGRIRGDRPLYDGVAEMAVAAAFEDPRFEQLTNEEFEQLEIEVSVLSKLQRVREFDQIKVGTHGLMIKLDFNSGLLLPQVATEHGWNNVEFIEQTCLKAGLPKNSYKDKFAEVYTFTAQVF
ncbi:MAG: AmmeMemoRadiSam system protein B [bacterium]|nr:AmmeMemoRadiSam system protein B [bacterium]